MSGNIYINVLFCSIFSFKIVLPIRLLEVGQLTLPKSIEKYETGQLFFHRIFGYRGVILFPWLARVYDRDVVNKTEK